MHVKAHDHIHKLEDFSLQIDALEINITVQYITMIEVH